MYGWRDHTAAHVRVLNSAMPVFTSANRQVF
jgi:hypothetical protein